MKIRSLPFGYQYENGIIICHPKESRIVQEVFTEYLQGSSLLTIAKKLTDKGIEYLPGAASWNKARLKRMIDDERYLGNETYPPIIQKDTFSNTQTIKTKRNTQKNTDRSAEIFKMTTPVVCGSCGQPMRRRHDSRTSYGEKWICPCGIVVKIGDEELFKSIIDCMNILIANPQLIHSVQKNTDPSITLRRAENEIGRMLDSSIVDKEKLKNKIFERASLLYEELDTTERTTELLKAAFEKSKPLSLYNRELTERTVKKIALYADRSISFTLINGQRIGEIKCNRQRPCRRNEYVPYRQRYSR